MVVAEAKTQVWEEFVNGLVDQCGGPSFYEGGPEGVFQLTGGSHSSAYLAIQGY